MRAYVNIDHVVITVYSTIYYSENAAGVCKNVEMKSDSAYTSVCPCSYVLTSSTQWTRVIERGFTKINAKSIA